MSERNIDRLVKLAAKNIDKGVIEEPRVYYDVITLAQPPEGSLPGDVSVGDPDAFINREQFPVRITHLSAQLLWKSVDGTVVGLDESKIQGAGLTLRHHDEYYMSPQFLPVPQWANAYVALSPAITMSSVTWEFPAPVILSARDSLRVEVATVLYLQDVSGIQASVAFTGTGLLSGRPYFFGASVELPNEVGMKRLFNPSQLRNNGAEPVAITNMTLSQPGFTVTDEEGAQQYIGGNVRLLDVQIRQQGNGTNADWFRGPVIPVARPRCPAGLLGFNGGRSVVHRFPGDGLIWEPGDGIVPQLRAIVENLQESADEVDVMPDIALSLMGYVSIV